MVLTTTRTHMRRSSDPKACLSLPARVGTEFTGKCTPRPTPAPKVTRDIQFSPQHTLAGHTGNQSGQPGALSSSRELLMIEIPSHMCQTNPATKGSLQIILQILISVRGQSNPRTRLTLTAIFLTHSRRNLAPTSDPPLVTTTTSEPLHPCDQTL
jgi:hypothetical protein